MKYILDHLKSMHSKLFINKLNVYIFFFLLTLGYLFSYTHVLDEIPKFFIYTISVVIFPGILIGSIFVENIVILFERIFFTPSPLIYDMPSSPSGMEKFFVAIFFVLYALLLSRVTANIYLRIKSSLKKLIKTTH